MAKEDEEKTAFITPFGVFCYVKMPCGLITAGNTFQRTVQGALSDQLGSNVEAYVDDIVVTAAGFEQRIEQAPASISVLSRSELDARRLLRASVVYLPLLFLLCVVDVGF